MSYYADTWRGEPTVFDAESDPVAIGVGKYPKAKENVRLIVKTLNAHADLLAACRQAFTRLTDNDMIEAGSFEITEILIAAIAKAEE
ncbi:MAG: hypothetical protein ACRETN_07600 [Nevskiales bacterium]